MVLTSGYSFARLWRGEIAYFAYLVSRDVDTAGSITKLTYHNSCCGIHTGSVQRNRLKDGDYLHIYGM